MGIKELQRKLLRERKQLARRLRRLASVKAGADDEGQGDFADQGQNSQILAEVLHARKLVLHQIKEIDVTLESLGKNVFGLCKECGAPIDPARLEVNPHAHLCIHCQKKAVKKAPPAFEQAGGFGGTVLAYS